MPYTPEQQKEDEELLALSGKPKPIALASPPTETPEVSELKRLRSELSDPRYAIPADLGVSEFKAAQDEDRAQGHHNRARDYIQAAFTNKPVQFRPRGPGLADDLLKQRGLAKEGLAEKRQGILDSANLGKAIKSANDLDPTSQSNVAYRQYLKNNFSDQFVGYPDELFGQITRADADNLFDITKLRAELDARKAAAEAKKNDDKDKKDKAGREASEGLRKEVMTNQVTKDTQAISAAYAKMKAAAATPSAAGDLSLIFGYMKVLDPGSTVREGEFANAQNAGGVDSRVVAMYNNIRNGQRLTPEVRADFMGQARGLYDAQLGRFKAFSDPYRALASKQGVDPGDVVFDMFGERRQPTAGAAPSPAQGEAAAPAAPDTLILNEKRYRRQADGSYMPE